MLAPLREFLRLEAAGGILLMLATAAGMLLANSPVSAHYLAAIDYHVGPARLGLQKSVLHWTDDGLMVLFFLVVGLELKREVLTGHLSSWRAASLPAVAALGGMAGPALIYAAINAGDPVALRGWAIPAATDIAFAMGVFLLLGSRATSSLKIFLLSIAVFDDLGAIVIIAIFYSSSISVTALGVAGVCIGILAWMNARGVTRLWPYLAMGLPLWFAVLASGVHATLAGVILAAFVPLRVAANTTSAAAEETPLRRLERALHPVVAFGIVPLFALVNAGVPLAGLTPAALLHPVPLGVTIGLFLGKPIGILATCGAAVAFGVSSLPPQSTWRQIIGLSILCGIGFTMSLFIASLSWDAGGPAYDGLERLGILLGSLLSSIVGYVILRFALPARAGAAA